MPLQRVNTISRSDVETRLNKLAVKYGKKEGCFEEAVGNDMSEFDFLKWSHLIQQRAALNERFGVGVLRDVKSNSERSANAPRIYRRSHLINRFDESGLRELAA